MIEGLEPMYDSIAESIHEAIMEPWNEAKMVAVFYADSITYFGEYTSAADGRLKDFGTLREAQRAFREIRKRFREAGKPLWGQATFELKSDGKFNIKWGYDNCDENGDTRFDDENYKKQDEERRKRLSEG